MIASPALRLRRIRATAVLLCGLSLLVVVLSAYLRLDAAGLGCADWPACYGRLLAGDPPATQFGPLRLLHRATASLSLLLAGYLAWCCWRRPAVQPADRPALLLLLLMLALAVLGIWSSDPRLVVVSFLNLLGGLGLVTFSWRVVLATRTRSMLDTSGPPTWLLRVGAATLSLTVVLGALIGARYAALACDSFPHCDGHWWPAAAGWAALSAFATLTGVPTAGDLGGMTLHLLHRYAALVTLLVLGSAGWQALSDTSRRPAAIVLLLLLVGEVALGSLTVLSGFTLCLAISHGVCAALLLASVATLLRR
ncbi:COX15/CtaA family protein [Accumulibacter sp.]|uniref:COX15/CtaA family protein n=1 Tax=Accumulibacter sp. TaxID=2053492 RepID=UPI00260452A0|nr:COX15/CtaA family protein [Accumulibacter sp.]